jgi:oligopeptidase B
VRAYLEAENAYTQAVMADTAGLRETLYREMVGRIEETDRSAPVRWGGYFYYDRTEAGQQYRIWCRRRSSMDAPEEVLADGNACAQGRAYFQPGDLLPDPAHRVLAWSADYEGDENFEIRFRDLEAAAALEDVIPKAAYSLAWSACGRFLFYVVRDHALRPYKVFRHRLSGPAGEDVEVFTSPTSVSKWRPARRRMAASC